MVWLMKCKMLEGNSSKLSTNNGESKCIITSPGPCPRLTNYKMCRNQRNTVCEQNLQCKLIDIEYILSTEFFEVSDLPCAWEWAFVCHFLKPLIHQFRPVSALQGGLWTRSNSQGHRFPSTPSLPCRTCCHPHSIPSWQAGQTLRHPLYSNISSMWGRLSPDLHHELYHKWRLTHVQFHAKPNPDSACIQKVIMAYGRCPHYFCPRIVICRICESFGNV